MKLSELLIIALLVCSLTIIGCKDEESPTEPGGSDPNVFCDENACAANNVLKQQCVEAFNTCMAASSDANSDECAAAALLICKL